MKQALLKLKGQTLKSKIGDITLLQPFRQEDCQCDQLYMSTSLTGTTAKIYDLQFDSAQERFRHERKILSQGKYSQLAIPILIEEFQIKKQTFGVILLPFQKDQFLKVLQPYMGYSDWLALADRMLAFIKLLQQTGEVFLNINSWSIARDANSEWKLIDAEFMGPQGSYSQLAENHESLMDLCQKDHRYRSPELLDQYSKNVINYSSDLFSLGIVLYESLFHVYPFDSKLSQINAKPKAPEEDAFFAKFVIFMLKPHQQRASLSALSALLDIQRKNVPKDNLKNMSSGSTNQSKGSIFSAFTQMFSKLTTETQGWYLNFAEDNQQEPEDKYLSQLLSKLSKKQDKIQKLQATILKCLDETNSSRRNQMFKTALLLLQLFRKGVGTMNHSWQNVLDGLQHHFCKDSQIVQICSLCRRKLQLHEQFKSLFAGNYFIQDFAKFKLISHQNLEALTALLAWLIQSINSYFLFAKQKSKLHEYAKHLLCDQILDLVSIIIFSIICMRKDSQIGLRKSPLIGLEQLEKKMNGLLKKISSLSNHVSSHAIYSLEAEFLYYKQQIQIRQNPTYTSLEHFYKNCREYKGLVMPYNYQLNYNSGIHKDYLSNQHKRPESFTIPQENYDLNADESDQQNRFGNKMKMSELPTKTVFEVQVSQKTNIQSQAPQKMTLKKVESKDIKNIGKIDSPSKNKSNNKIVSFDQFFNLKSAKPQGIQKNPFDLQPNVQSKQKNIFSGEVKAQKTQIASNVPKNTQKLVAFEQIFTQPKQAVQAQKAVVKKPTAESFFADFGANFKVDKAGKNQGLNNSYSQQLLQVNINSYEWLKNSKFMGPPPSSLAMAQVSSSSHPQVDPALLEEILRGLKLKQLKEAIYRSQNIIIDFNKIKLQKVIGSGSAGEVYLGSYKGETVAVKKVKTKQNPNALKQFERELLTYIKIKRNPYLVSLVGLSKHEDDYFLITQYCNSGSLFDLLHKRANTTQLSWQQRIQLALQTAKGMLVLHQMSPPIIHRDLKSLNVFVIEKQGAFTAKVADFGLSRSPEAEMMTMYLGTLHWMAPQLLDNKQYSLKVDVYSFAVVLWEICSRRTPYSQLSSPMAIIKHVTIERKRPHLGSISADCPPQLISLMQACWSHDAAQRPLFKQIINQLQKIKPSS